MAFSFGKAVPLLANALAAATERDDGALLITFRRKEHVLESSVTGKTRPSFINLHGVVIQECLPDGNLGEPRWICTPCDKNGSFSDFKAVATSSAISHLRKKHRITQATTLSSDADDDGVAVTEPSTNTSNISFIRVWTHQLVKKARDYALTYILRTNSPFGAFDDPSMKCLMLLLNPTMYLIGLGRSTMTEHLASTYVAKKELIKLEFKQALTQIHLSFDMWTSPNHHAILGVSAHFLDKKGTLQQRLIALRQQVGAHTGQGLAEALHEVVSDWKLLGKIGCLISDNASNNDTCGKVLYQGFDLSPRFREQDAVHRRIRCYGHILNLVGQAILYGKDTAIFHQASEGLDAEELDEDDLANWRRRGPIAKLHNFVLWVRASPQRSQMFKGIFVENLESDHDQDTDAESIAELDTAAESATELQLILNNATRWNSTYLMIERALRKRDQIVAFLATNNLEGNPNHQVPEEGHLNAEDWQLLVELKHILQPLYRQTLMTQGWATDGYHGSLWEVLTGIEYLLDTMEQWKEILDDVAQEALATHSTNGQRRARGRPRARTPDAPSLPP
ncbi:uncharacterized protein CPUR_08782, partial [Claviceps purpurea 20.1]